MGLTAEAQEVLRQAGIHDVSGSDVESEIPVYDPKGDHAAWFAGVAADSENLYVGYPDSAPEQQTPGTAGPDMGFGAEIPRPEIGAFIDQSVPKPAVVISRKEERSDRALNDPERRQLKDSTGPPDKDDWLDFFSRIILRVGMESYVDYVFRNVDENLLTERELDQIKPTRELREQIATPFAVYCTKNKWTRKHGREIVAAADSVEALVNLGIWIRRVNRIAKRHKPHRAQRPKVSLRPEGVSNVSDGQDQGQGREEFEGSRNGHIGTGFTIINPGSG